MAIKPSATLIGAEIAKSLELPLDLFLVHSFKVHDLTVGAVANGWDGVLLKEQIIRYAYIHYIHTYYIWPTMKK